LARGLLFVLVFLARSRSLRRKGKRDYVTKNLMLDDSNSTKNVVHFILPKPVLMQIAEQVNKNGQASGELMQFSLEPSESVPSSAMASSHA
jgi:hypothetical protein